MTSQRTSAEMSDSYCNLHQEKLLIFCVDDEEPICVVCQISKKHKDHQLTPVEEAVLDMKEDLKTELNPIQEKLQKFIKVKHEFEKTVKHLKTQVQLTEKQIKEEFKKVHQFLRDEEEARLAALREEEEQKCQRMKDMIENISEHISTLSDNVRDIEKIMDTEDIFLVKNFKTTKERAQVTLQDPEPVSGALIDVAKHLGSLRFRVWEKMLQIVQYTSVSLDPNTAAPWLSVSSDLSRVRNIAVKQQLPDNPERLVCYPDILGSEAFSSGHHSWDIEVGDKPEWTIGVVKESINRKGQITYSPEDGFWVVFLRNSDEYKACTSPSTHLTVEKRLQRIRVQLDYEGGDVSFYDPSNMSLVYTFKDTFTEPLYPYFYLGPNIDGSNPGALKICPVDVSVTVMTS